MSSETLELSAACESDSHDRALVTVIEPTERWASLRLGEVWRARELILFLIWRDVKVRYKQTVVGAGWAVLQPLITVLIFSLLLGRYAHFPADGVAYPIFVFAGLLPWTYFAYSINQSGKSLVDNERLITKIYFPRLALPIATTFTGIPDFLVGCVVFAVMMVIFLVAPSWHIVALPLFLLLAVVTSLGVGFWLSGLNVRYRDVRYVLPFLTQIWMFASPVVYSTKIFGKVVKHSHRAGVAHHVVNPVVATVYSLNPMTGVINGFRWALLNGPGPDPLNLSLSVLVSVTILVTGVYYFKHMDKSFADVI